MPEPGGILSRYARILDAVACAPEGLSLTEITQATDLSTSTAHRLINVLLTVGYIERQGSRKVYVLGPRLLRFLHLGITPVTLSSLARPILEELVSRFSESAHLAKLMGRSVETALVQVPTYERQSHVHPGRVMPVNAAAAAKAIFAFQDDTLLAEVLSAPMTKYTEHTRVAEADVRADLAEVRRRGFAVCVDELDPGVVGYACPVHLKQVGVIYSVGMVGLSQRMEQHRTKAVVSALSTAAEELAHAMVTKLPDPRLEEHREVAGG